MVYAALPAVYLDPNNWNQQSQQQQQQGFQAIGRADGGVDRAGGTEQQQLPHPVASQPGGTSATSSSKPLSTADRARLAKLPQTESAPVRCPRCDSTNTKFCYFNNYSLSQPRHFCKACRRYWTRGGALRNVPVGGGCRRNKRTKGGESTKGLTAPSRKSPGTATSSFEAWGGGAVNPSITIQSQFPFLASLYPLQDYAGTVAANYGSTAIAANDPDGYHATGATSAGPDQWMIHSMQVQNFPYLAGMEPSPPPLVTPSSLGSAYEHITSETGPGTVSRLAAQLHAKPTTCTGLATQQPPVKMEESIRPQGLMNLLRPQLLGVSGIVNNQYWVNTITGQHSSAEGGDGGAPWSGLSGFTSSTVNLL